MADLEILGAQRALCRRLRSKGMYIEVERFADDDLVPSMSDGFVWCTHTQNCLGPDGKVAEVESCVPGRVCWEGGR
jgi:hypothetical protein